MSKPSKGTDYLLWQKARNGDILSRDEKYHLWQKAKGDIVSLVDEIQDAEYDIGDARSELESAEERLEALEEKLEDIETDMDFLFPGADWKKEFPEEPGVYTKEQLEAAGQQVLEL